MQNYMDELVRLMKSDLPDAQIAEALEDYHEKDIATVLEMLDQQRRVRLYHILGKERVSEVFTYLSDVGKYLKELPIENDAAIVAGMDADDAHEADFAALPMTLYIRNGELSYACGALTAE